MLFYLSKLLYIFLKPLVWVTFSFICFFVFKKKVWKQRFLGFGVLVLLAMSNPGLQNIVLKWYEGESTPLSAVTADYDYVILLGGFSNLDKASGMGYSMNERGNRLMTTLELYKSGKADKILISGGAGDIWQDKESEAVVVKNFLIGLGLDSMDIITEHKSRNTYENAVFTRQLLQQIKPNAKCLLVTSAFHMPRAKGLFLKQNIHITAYPTDFINRPLNRPDHIIIPSSKALWTWEFIIKEWIGITLYRMAGKL